MPADALLLRGTAVVSEAAYLYSLNDDDTTNKNHNNNTNNHDNNDNTTTTTTNNNNLCMLICSGGALRGVGARHEEPRAAGAAGTRGGCYLISCHIIE